jgi:hypothetical protein
MRGVASRLEKSRAGRQDVDSRAKTHEERRRARAREEDKATTSNDPRGVAARPRVEKANRIPREICADEFRDTNRDARLPSRRAATFVTRRRADRTHGIHEPERTHARRSDVVREVPSPNATALTYPASRPNTHPMQAESPENQTPVALSPNAMAQRDMNAMPAHVPPVSVGKKTFDARYARGISRAGGSRTRRVGGNPRVVAPSRIRHRSARGSALTPSRPDAPVPSRRRRFRSPTDSNMSPASKFVNQKKKGSKLANGCVARPARPDPRGAHPCHALPDDASCRFPT